MSSGTRKQWYTAPELAEILGVDPSTVQKWIRDGELKPDMVTLVGKHARFTPETVQRLKRSA